MSDSAIIRSDAIVLLSFSRTMLEAISITLLNTQTTCRKSLELIG